MSVSGPVPSGISPVGVQLPSRSFGVAASAVTGSGHDVTPAHEPGPPSTAEAGSGAATGVTLIARRRRDHRDHRDLAAAPREPYSSIDMANRARTVTKRS